MALPLFRFPPAWGGSMNCGSVGFSGEKRTCRKIFHRSYDEEVDGYYDEDDVYSHKICKNSSETHNICACHHWCSQCCSVANANPSQPVNWSAIIEPYAKTSVSCEWSEQVISDLTLKLNGLDPQCGVGVLHGLLLLKTDDAQLCRNFIELGVDVEKRYVKFGPPLTTMSSLGIDEKLEGGTALHFAALLGRKKCLEALLDAGADVKAKTTAGLTVLELTDDAEIKEILETATSSGIKTLAQLAKEEKFFAVRHRMRAGKLKPRDLAQKHKGKTALEWIWAKMCKWRFAMKLDEDSLVAFKLMSEMKYRYGEDSLRDLSEPTTQGETQASAGLVVDELAGDQRPIDYAPLLKNQEQMINSLTTISTGIEEMRLLLDDFMCS